MSFEIEVSQRAGFQKKLDKCMGLPIKSDMEYLDQARNEISQQNQSLVDFIDSLVIKESGQ